MSEAMQQSLPLGQEYRDFADVIESTGETISPTPQPTDHNFPVKLHYILSELEKDGMEHIASWAPHGRCFKVHDTNQFVEEVLRRWFRQSQIASFQRQLNIYGFTRITFGPDKHSYYHECFLRGMFFLSRRIQRTTIKGQGPRRASCYQSQPNFYNMRFLVPSSTAASTRVSIGTNSLRVERSEALTGRSTIGVARVSYPAGPSTAISPSVASNLTLRDMLDIRNVSSYGSTYPFLAGPSSMATLRGVESIGVAPQRVLPRQFASTSRLIPASRSIASASRIRSVPANMSDVRSSSLARAMVLESMAASRRRQEAALVQEHIRAQLISGIARQANGEAEEVEDRRRQLVLALLNGNL